MEANLKAKLEADMWQSMKDRDDVRRSTLRLLLAAVKNAEIAKRGSLDDPGILGVVVKEIKQRNESIEAFKLGARPDLVAREEAEMAILKEYLPRQLSREEVIAEVRRVIEEVGAQGPRDKGKVMPMIMARLKGKADGREINEIVTGLLTE
ncbi:MAG: GatB/YqeY domain-containing protein [Dehalococcoidales bacterium]|nr:GatB/YqeY domain-containing protein [Dehalococcoidales bacterium]